MSNKTAIVRRESSAPHPSGIQVSSLDDLNQLANMAHQSGMFKDVQGAAQAGVKILRGAELGLGPMESMSNLHVVEGKVSMSAQLMGALAQRAGYRYRVVVSNDTECRLHWFAPDGMDLGESSFSMSDANRAGLANRNPWRKYPRAMLRARALSEGARLFAAGALLGVYSDEEAQNFTPALPATTPTPQPTTAPAEHAAPEADDSAVSVLVAVPAEDRARLMKKLHAIGRELGLEHEELRNLIGLKSLKAADAHLLGFACDMLGAANVKELRDAWGNTALRHRNQLQSLKDWCKAHMPKAGGEG